MSLAPNWGRKSDSIADSQRIEPCPWRPGHDSDDHESNGRYHRV
ncbi:hypothetical protein [Kibdelosporangium philippinense]